FIRIGYWTYPTTPHWLTVFGGSWYRIHLTEPICWGTTWAAFALLRYYKDDKGRTIAERGIDQVRTTERKKSFLRFAAIYGTCNVFFLLFYIIPTNAIAIHGDSWPRDTLKRSYFTNYLCGPGTDYACPSQGTPIPRPKSAHLDPAGELVPGEVPNSPRPPMEFSRK
ncbi:MAG: spirocyclase AveC family protein, partial [Actinomycetota bacterium]